MDAILLVSGAVYEKDSRVNVGILNAKTLPEQGLQGRQKPVVPTLTAV
ncbi:hypothetical protein [Pseudomaricurvus sp.]